MVDIDFTVGEKYENMKGTYEVVTIRGEAMRIRWDDGEEVTTTRTLQTQIIHRMQMEREAVEKSKKPKKRKPKKKK